jgi:hypothetical protein
VSQTTAKYTLDQLRELGEDILHRVVEPNATPEQDGLFAAINVDTGEYEIDPKLNAAVARMEARFHEPYLWLARIGRPSLFKFARRT